MNNMSVTLNQGLKSYQESITHEIGSLKAKVNLCPIASNVVVDENSIEIVDSYLFGDEEKSQILDIIMESNEYKEYGYKRTKNSYMREWRVHNFVHAFIPFGEIGNKTKNVNLNREEEKNSHSWAYKFFW